MSNHTKAFRPKAHILRLLGEELIKSPTMAIYELIKNSYDADASFCNVTFREVDNQEETSIEILDDGLGMTKEVVEKVWLEPGTDHRKSILEDGSREIHKSKLLGRTPTGEKGVGRFAVHRLGSNIKVLSRPAIVKTNDSGKKEKILLDYEISISIDWSEFTQGSYLDDVKVTWSVLSSTSNFPKSSGTKIVITSLKEVWTRGMARNLKRNTLSMLSPKASSSSFVINLNFNNSWLEDFPKVEELLEAAPYKMTALLDEKYNLTFEYSFSPQLNKKVGWRELEEDNPYNGNAKALIRPFIRKHYKDLESEEDYIEEKLAEFDKSKSPFGDLMIELYSYDSDAKSLRDTYGHTSLLHKFVKGSSGIRVFKDDLRIFDYGEPGNDWLGLDIERVNRKEWFSNNQVIGFIYLQADSSTTLIEKTNREGFIENYSYSLFYKLIKFILTQFKEERHTDSQRWREFHKKDKKDSSTSPLKSFYDAISKIDFKKPSDKKKLEKEAKNLETSYRHKEETLLLPAGVGLTASVALHEIEKLVPRLQQTVNENPIKNSLIKDQVNELKQYTDGILSILKSGGDRIISIKDNIEKALLNYEYKLRKRKIKATIFVTEELSVKCDKRYFLTALLNLIDNSVYWLDSTYDTDKKIGISAEKTSKGVSIAFADSGPGFTDQPEILVKPFRSRKDGGTGLGLYIIDTIMVQYGKLILHESANSLNGHVPLEDYKGAIVELVFTKN